MYVFRETGWAGSKNKFWNVEKISDTELKVVWGRIGAKGQSKNYTFEGRFGKYEANEFASKKLHEKLRKGYTEIPDDRFQILAAQAAAIGTRNKIYKLQWVKMTQGSFVEVDDIQLSDPDITPALYLRADIKTGKATRTYELLIKADGVQRVIRLPNGDTQYEDMPDDDAVVKKIKQGLAKGIA
jgi:predicted DNA-binding WGR domain protein